MHSAVESESRRRWRGEQSAASGLGQDGEDRPANIARRRSAAIAMQRQRRAAKRDRMSLRREF